MAQDVFIKKEITLKEGTLQYNLLQPSGYNSGEIGAKKFPLVVFLHGAGERGADNEKQIIHIRELFTNPVNMSKYPAFVVAPQCPEGEKWTCLNWADSLHIMTDEPTRPMLLTKELIDSLIKLYPVDTCRIYITGLSMGGYGVWDAICRYPGFFASAAPVCGGGDISKAGLLVNLPLWVFHGTDDKVVPVYNSQSMVKEIKKSGGKPRYSEYKNTGHNSWIKAYKEKDFLNWMFNQDNCR
ncbi:MAG: PHB depolymerase family esterase [Bacteroidales bacterium]